MIYESNRNSIRRCKLAFLYIQLLARNYFLIQNQLQTSLIETRIILCFDIHNKIFRLQCVGLRIYHHLSKVKLISLDNLNQFLLRIFKIKTTNVMYNRNGFFSNRNRIVDLIMIAHYISSWFLWKNYLLWRNFKFLEQISRKRSQNCLENLNVV